MRLVRFTRSPSLTFWNSPKSTLEAVNLGDAVTDFDHGAHFHHRDAGFKILDLLANDFVDFVCFDWFHMSFPIAIADCQFLIRI